MAGTGVSYRRVGPPCGDGDDLTVWAWGARGLSLHWRRGRTTGVVPGTRIRRVEATENSLAVLLFEDTQTDTAMTVGHRDRDTAAALGRGPIVAACALVRGPGFAVGRVADDPLRVLAPTRVAWLGVALAAFSLTGLWDIALSAPAIVWLAESLGSVF